MTEWEKFISAVLSYSLNESEKVECFLSGFPTSERAEKQKEIESFSKRFFAMPEKKRGGLR